jgi:hypothetical protein
VFSNIKISLQPARKKEERGRKKNRNTGGKEVSKMGADTS